MNTFAELFAVTVFDTETGVILYDKKLVARDTEKAKMIAFTDPDFTHTSNLDDLKVVVRPLV